MRRRGFLALLGVAAVGRSRAAIAQTSARGYHLGMISPGAPILDTSSNGKILIGSQGREAGRPAGDAVHQVRVRHQPQDRQGARPDRAARPAGRRRRGDRVRRREFITLVGGGVASGPLAARAQQAAMPVIGYLGTSSREMTQRFVAAFLLSLKEAGFIEGQNVAIEYRWADDQYDRLSAMAADLVRRQVTAIVAVTQLAAVAAKSATATIPIVFTTAVDPVAHGLVASLNRHGGNMTGGQGMV